MSPHQEALLTVAKQVLWDCAQNACEMWESQPDIGEEDWNTIVALVESAAPLPDQAEYAAAYALLELYAEEQQAQELLEEAEE